MPRRGLRIKNLTSLLNDLKCFLGVEDGVVKPGVDHMRESRRLVKAEVEHEVHAYNLIVLADSLPQPLLDPKERLFGIVLGQHKLYSFHLAKLLLEAKRDQLRPQLFIITLFFIEFALVKQLHDGLLVCNFVVPLLQGSLPSFGQVWVCEEVVSFIDEHVFCTLNHLICNNN